MPIRQNILRKGKAPKQNLLQFDVLQEESGVLGDLTTSRFFKISEFPSVLPSGNSSFFKFGKGSYVVGKVLLRNRDDILENYSDKLFDALVKATR